MNRKYFKYSKKYLKISLIIFFAFMIWFESIYCGNILKIQYNSVSIRLEEEKVSRKEIENALENEKNKNKEVPKITSWDLSGKMDLYSNDIYGDQFENYNFIKNSETNIKKQKVYVYKVFGDSNIMYPMELIDGSYLINDDNYGCIIDEKTSYDLFGTKYSIGNSVNLDEKIYYVRGVVKSDRPAIILEANDKNQQFSNLEITYSDYERSLEMVTSFIMQNNLGEEYTIFDGQFYGNIAGRLAKIPLWILAFYLIIKTINFMIKNIKGFKTENIIYVIGSILFIVICIYVTKFKLYYPLRLIPSKWSDFQFWSDKYNEFKNLINDFKYAYPYPKDIMMIEYLKKNIIFSIISIINIIFFLKSGYLEKWFKIKRQV